ncbi:hypothetical protein HAZT_HAZT006184, partial [Hyalella azteca]
NKDIFAGENHQKLVSESKNLHSIVSKAAVTAILSDDVHSTIELAYALLLRVQDKSLVSKAVKNLAASWPVPELQHLKRVKKFPKISNSRDRVVVQVRDLRDVHPLAHAAMVAVDHVARTLGGPSESDECTSSYICTGLDAYLSHEPCMMCAMALLHSRVQRVFYHHRNAEKGALGSVVKLHTLPNINHRYEVFNVTAVEDC